MKKTCTKCSVEKELSEFYRHKTGKYGVSGHCKDCKKKYAMLNKERIDSYQKQYRIDNKQRNKNRDKEYYQKNKDKIKVQSKVYRKIKSLTGMAPNQLIQELRLRRSIELLQQKSHTIEEIAYNSGFNSPSYFTRLFKKRYDLLPTSFLKL